LGFPQVIALLNRIIGFFSGVMSALGLITGLVNESAKEKTANRIQVDTTRIINDLELGTASLSAIATDIEVIGGTPSKSLQDVIDAIGDIGPVTLPDPPPSGYGGSTPADLWGNSITGWAWYPHWMYGDAAGLLQEAANAAETHTLGEGVIYPDAPDFAWTNYNINQFVFDMGQRNNAGPPAPTGVDWTAWDGSETIVAFLNRVASAFSWSYTNPRDVVTPGWAWSARPTLDYYGQWKCLVSDADLPAKSARLGGIQQTTRDYTVLSIAIGLASLFATGGGDVSAIVAELATLLADSTDIGAALTSLLSWLSGRDQSPNQEQGLQLVTALGDLDSLSADLLSDYNALALDISNAKSALETDISNVRGTNSPTIADVRSDLSTIRGDNATTLKGLSDKLDAISGKIDALGLPQPGYPGPDYVTFGDPVAITTDMTIEGPLDGAIYHVTAAPATLAKSNIGGFTSWYRLGQAAFESEDGYLDAFQQVNWDHGTLLPRGMLNPAALVLHWTGGVTGTVTPWVRN
jgi:hypothetical protein